MILWFGFSLLTFALSVNISGISGLQGALALICFSLSMVVEPRTAPKYLIIFLVIFSLGAILSLASSLEPDLELSAEKLLRLRYWFFQALYGYSGVIFVKKILEMRHERLLLSLIKLVLASLSAIAIFQVVILGNSQARALSNEPSQAAGVLLFWLAFYIVVGYPKRQRFSYAFIFLGLAALAAIGSKASFLSVFLLIAPFAFRFSIKKYALMTVTVAAVAVSDIDLLSPVNKITYLFKVLHAHGLYGLSYGFLIWDSWIVRIGSMLSAVLLFLDYPLGLGFGSYDQVFPSYVSRVVPDNTSMELSRILSNETYATPKSYILEFIVSTGALGFAFLLWMQQQVAKRHRWTAPTFAFLALMLQAALVELTSYLPMLLMLFTALQYPRKPGGKP